MDEVIARGVNGVGWWYFPDRNGNTNVVTDGINTVRESYRYDAFGLPSVYSGTGTYLGSGSAIGNRFTFTGREWRSLFGFFEYRARAYNPTLGRFMSEDPKALMPAIIICIGIAPMIHSTERTRPVKFQKSQLTAMRFQFEFPSSSAAKALATK
jgi:RHS repeat-associated protein